MVRIPKSIYSISDQSAPIFHEKSVMDLFDQYYPDKKEQLLEESLDKHQFGVMMTILEMEDFEFFLAAKSRKSLKHLAPESLAMLADLSFYNSAPNKIRESLFDLTFSTKEFFGIDLNSERFKLLETIQNQTDDDFWIKKFAQLGLYTDWKTTIVEKNGDLAPYYFKTFTTLILSSPNQNSLRKLLGYKKTFRAKLFQYKVLTDFAELNRTPFFVMNLHTEEVFKILLEHHELPEILEEEKYLREALIESQQLNLLSVFDTHLEELHNQAIQNESKKAKKKTKKKQKKEHIQQTQSNLEEESKDSKPPQDDPQDQSIAQINPQDLPFSNQSDHEENNGGADYPVPTEKPTPFLASQEEETVSKDEYDKLKAQNEFKDKQIAELKAQLLQQQKQHQPDSKKKHQPTSKK